MFSWFEDEVVGNVYATIHLRKKSFWTRLKYGIKYIFGYQCRYGAFDEFIFSPKDAGKLQKVVGFLKRKNITYHDAEIDTEKRWRKIVEEQTGVLIDAIDKNIVEQTAKTYSEGQHETKNKKTQD